MHALDLGYSPPGLMRKKKSTNHVRTGAAAIAGLVLLIVCYKVVRRSPVPTKDARMPSLTVDPNIAAGKPQIPAATQQQIMQPQSIKEQHHHEGMPHRTRHGRRSLSTEEEASGG
jgi:hypothetical protein